MKCLECGEYFDQCEDEEYCDPCISRDNADFESIRGMT